MHVIHLITNVIVTIMCYMLLIYAISGFHVLMTSLSYGRIFCLESQKIDGTYQRYNHYF